MRRSCGLFLFLGILSEICAQGIPAPFYAASSIVNAASAHPTALAPNAIATIFGKDLSFTTRALSGEDIRAGVLPTALPGTGVRVLLDRIPAHIYYVSPTQINFLVPSILTPGTVDVQVDRQGRYGQAVQVTIATSSPALFQIDPQYALVARPDGSVVTRDQPARPGDIVILYANGLGLTRPRFNSGQLVTFAAPLDRLSDFQITISGHRIHSSAILYAGGAPGFAGLYQINLRLPSGGGREPEIRIGFGDPMSPSNVLLPYLDSDAP